MLLIEAVTFLIAALSGLLISTLPVAVPWANQRLRLSQDAKYPDEALFVALNPFADYESYNWTRDLFPKWEDTQGYLDLLNKQYALAFVNSTCPSNGESLEWMLNWPTCNDTEYLIHVASEPLLDFNGQQTQHSHYTFVPDTSSDERLAQYGLALLCCMFLFVLRSFVSARKHWYKSLCLANSKNIYSDCLVGIPDLEVAYIYRDPFDTWNPIEWYRLAYEELEKQNFQEVVDYKLRHEEMMKEKDAVIRHKNSELTESNEIIHQLDQENMACGDALRELETIVAKTNDALAEKEGVLAKALRQIEVLGSKLKIESQFSDTWKRRYCKIAATWKELQEAKDKIVDLTAKVKDWSNGYSSLKKELADANKHELARVAELKAACDVKDQEIIKLKVHEKTNVDLQKTVVDLQVSLSSALSDKNIAVNAAAVEKASCEELVADQATNVAKFTELSTTLDVKKAECSSLSLALGASKAQIGFLKRAAEATASKLDASVKKALEACSKEQARAKELEELCHEKDVKVSQVEEASRKKDSTIQELKQASQKLEEANQEQGASVLKLRETAATMSSKNDELEKAKSTAEANLSTMKDDIEVKTSRMAQLEQAEKDQKSRIKELEDCCSTRDLKAGELKAKVDVQQQANDTLQASLTAALKEIETKSAGIDRLQQATVSNEASTVGDEPDKSALVVTAPATKDADISMLSEQLESMAPFPSPEPQSTPYPEFGSSQPQAMEVNHETQENEIVTEPRHQQDPVDPQLYQTQETMDVIYDQPDHGYRFHEDPGMTQDAFNQTLYSGQSQFAVGSDFANLGVQAPYTAMLDTPDTTMHNAPISTMPNAFDAAIGNIVSPDPGAEINGLSAAEISALDALLSNDDDQFEEDGSFTPIYPEITGLNSSYGSDMLPSLGNLGLDSSPPQSLNFLNDGIGASVHHMIQFPIPGLDLLTERPRQFSGGSDDPTLIMAPLATSTPFHIIDPSVIMTTVATSAPFSAFDPALLTVPVATSAPFPTIDPALLTAPVATPAPFPTIDPALLTAPVAASAPCPFTDPALIMAPMATSAPDSTVDPGALMLPTASSTVPAHDKRDHENEPESENEQEPPRYDPNTGSRKILARPRGQKWLRLKIEQVRKAVADSLPRESLVGLLQAINEADTKMDWETAQNTKCFPLLRSVAEALVHGHEANKLAKHIRDRWQRQCEIPEYLLHNEARLKTAAVSGNAVRIGSTGIPRPGPQRTNQKVPRETVLRLKPKNQRGAPSTGPRTTAQPMQRPAVSTAPQTAPASSNALAPTLDLGAPSGDFTLNVPWAPQPAPVVPSPFASTLNLGVPTSGHDSNNAWKQPSVEDATEEL